MKTIAKNFVILAMLAAAGSQAASAAEYEWLVDPVPFEQRSTRLAEISVHRYVPEAGTGRILERRYLLTAGGLLARAGDFAVPALVTVPEEAFDKLLVSASAWLAYGQLGPHALANFRLVNDLMPIDVAGRWHYEVALSAEANGNVGRVPNLSSRSEVALGAPLVGGFVVEGASRTVLIRAVGPGLRQFGVNNALAAVRLELFRGDLRLGAHEDWSASPAERLLVERATQRVGAFPLVPGSRDAATAVTLPPGNYTVHASGRNGTGGAVLLEVYLLN
ncbi:MAG: hypothetical protein HZC55_07690 [Verrucomicrobia bacterium]|nr:hypothetical protein [Verrucomicrobiota bacterium]